MTRVKQNEGQGDIIKVKAVGKEPTFLVKLQN